MSLDKDTRQFAVRRAFTQSIFLAIILDVVSC